MPLRNYAHQLRIVQEGPEAQKNDHAHYSVNAAYVAPSQSPTEQRLRTLNDYEPFPTSARKPEPPHLGGAFPARTQTALFHEINPQDRDFLVGPGLVPPASRHDNMAGTKRRVHLGDTGASQHIDTTAPPAVRTHTKGEPSPVANKTPNKTPEK